MCGGDRIRSSWDEKEECATYCSDSSALPLPHGCTRARGASTANGGIAWNRGVAVVSTLHKEVYCVGPLLTLEDCSDPSAIGALPHRWGVRGAFTANGGSAWNSGGAVRVVSTIRREVSCVGSLLTLEDGMDTRVAVSGPDDETAGA